MSFRMSFLCFSVLLVLRLPRLGKRELILVLFVRLFGLCLFRFVGFLFLLGSGKGCGLWLWHSLDFSLTFFGFPIGTILAVFDLQVIPMLPTKFRINWLLGLGEEVKNRFLRWRPSLISDWNDFNYFWSPSHLPSFESIGLSVQEKQRKLDFQDGGHGRHLGSLIGTILAILDLQVTLMLPSKFRVNWLLGLREEAKNRWRPSWISYRNDFR